MGVIICSSFPNFSILVGIMMKIIFVVVVVLAIFAQAESQKKFGKKLGGRNKFLPRRIRLPRRLQRPHRLRRPHRIPARAHNHGGNKATSTASGKQHSLTTTGGGRCFKKFAPGKTLHFGAGSNHFTVPCQDCAAGNIVHVNSIQSQPGHANLEIQCHANSDSKLCQAWAASGCTFNGNNIACPSQCSCLSELANGELQHTHHDSSNRQVHYTLKCSENQGYTYTIQRKPSGGENWFDVVSSFTNTPATGTSGNSNGVGWSSGNTNTGGGTVGLNRRRRLLQSQQDS